MAAHVLANGQIVACDKVTRGDGAIRFFTGVYRGKYGLSDDNLIINDMPITFFSSSYRIAMDLVPFHKNNRLIHVVRLGTEIMILDNDGQIKAEINTPNIKRSKHLIPIDYDHLNKPESISIVEICDKFIFLHNLQLTAPQFNYNPTPLYMYESGDIIAARYDTKNNRLYSIKSDGVLSHIEIQNGTHDGVTHSRQPQTSLQDVNHFAVTDDGQFIACAHKDGTVTLHDEYAQQIGFATIQDATIFDLRFVDNDQDLLITTNKQAVRMNNFEQSFASQPAFSP